MAALQIVGNKLSQADFNTNSPEGQVLRHISVCLSVPFQGHRQRVMKDNQRLAILGIFVSDYAYTFQCTVRCGQGRQELKGSHKPLFSVTQSSVSIDYMGMDVWPSAGTWTTYH